MHIVFGTGILFAVTALSCLTVLGHNLKLEVQIGKGKKNGISNNENTAGTRRESS